MNVKMLLLAAALLGKSAVAPAAAPPDEPAVAPAESQPLVAANLAHAKVPEQRTVLDRSPTGFSRLWEAFSRRPCRTRIDRQPLSAALLAEVDVLLITGVAPEKPLAAGELTALKEFVARGGTLLLTNNDLTPEGIAAWLAVAEPLGIQSHGSVMQMVEGMAENRCHISRYSGAGLARWLPKVDDAPLYFRGTSAGPAGGSVLVSYDGAAMAAGRRIGRGMVYVFGGGDMIGNAFTASPGPDAGQPDKPTPANARLIDALAEELVSGIDRQNAAGKPAGSNGGTSCRNRSIVAGS